MPKNKNKADSPAERMSIDTPDVTKDTESSRWGGLPRKSNHGDVAKMGPYNTKPKAQFPTKLPGK